MTQMTLNIAVGSQLKDEVLHKCDWKGCDKKRHTVKLKYDNDGILKGDNSANLNKTDKYPWFIGKVNLWSEDKKKYLSRPQWSYPKMEDYFLDAKKGNIVDKIAKGKIKKSDLPPDLLAVVDNPEIKNSSNIQIKSLATHQGAEVAKVLNSKNCFPYEQRFEDWSDKRVYKEPEYPTEAHHLLSKQFFGGGTEGKRFKKLAHNAKLIGYDINCYKNGINLPRFAIDMVCHGLPQHEGNHDKTDYNKKVAKLLAVAQKKSLKFCHADIDGEVYVQKKLLHELDIRARRVRQYLCRWESGFELRTDNREKREYAYRRIKTMLCFDNISEGYPNVDQSKRKNSRCGCVTCSKTS